MGDKDADKAKNGVVEELTEAVQESYEAAAAMQESHAQLARRFYEHSVEAFEVQAQINRHTLQSVAELAWEQQEIFQRLSRESLVAYDGFLDSLFSYHREVLREPEEPGG